MAGDYTLAAVTEKRTRFFDGQYLVDQDFIDEQKYHLDRLRRHQRLLHVSGICEGLSVRATAANTVVVGPGTAIDADGRTLALAADVTVDLRPGEHEWGFWDTEIQSVLAQRPGHLVASDLDV